MSHTNVAILMCDTLRAMGLKHLLQRTYNVAANIVTTIEQLEGFANGIDYIFTDSHSYAAHCMFFMGRQSKTIVFTDHDATCQEGSVTIINSTHDETSITNQLSNFFSKHDEAADNKEGVLSAREIDVLRLVASGCINKEIAEKLNISINTVLTHRKNITAKLGIKSVSGLSFYAIMNGIIAPK